MTSHPNRAALSHAIATFVGTARHVWLLPLDAMFKIVGLRYGWLHWVFAVTPPKVLATMGRLRAERAVWRTCRRVPAYRELLVTEGLLPDRLAPIAILSRVPETDKANYVDQYPLASRCLDGQITFRGTTIDESSGSTGSPYNWIRSGKERAVAHRNISFFARYCFGNEPLVTINAFSMGAWATGINMSLGLNRNGIVKSTGPDIAKVVSTLRFLGPSFRYVICGYPPFLKHLLDEGDRLGFPWADYELHGIVGGEGMAEELRDLLLGRFQSIYSGYGATDIEIGMAGESPVSVAIRRIARTRPDVRRALFGEDPRLPMLFQYNPLIHHLEVNRECEILCTVSRLDVLAPRVRYNVHDEGGLMSFPTAHGILRRFGLDSSALGRESGSAGPRGPLPWAKPLPLPFLWIYGRRDATISVMGANIYPEDIEVLVYRDVALAKRLHSFLLSVAADESGTPRPVVSLELNDLEGIDDSWRARVATQVRDGLAGLNPDYGAAAGEFPGAMMPVVETYAIGGGPFAEDAGRIKQRRLLKPP